MQMTDDDAAQFLSDMGEGETEQIYQKWGHQFEDFLQKCMTANATFLLHREIMTHCDEIFALHLAERTGGQHGYSLMKAVLKSALPFAFLNNASSYAAFVCQLLIAHEGSSPFHKKMK